MHSPAVPVATTGTVYVAGVVPAAAVTVRVEVKVLVELAVNELGLNKTVAPDGRPTKPTPRFAVHAPPPVKPNVTVYVAEPPGATALGDCPVIVIFPRDVLSVKVVCA